MRLSAVYCKLGLLNSINLSTSSVLCGGISAPQEPREYKVRIEHKSGAGGAGGKKRKNELSLDWIFTCSCKPELRHWSFNGDGQPAVYPICKHIGACLIVHFH